MNQTSKQLTLPHKLFSEDCWSVMMCAYNVQYLHVAVLLKFAPTNFASLIPPPLPSSLCVHLSSSLFTFELSPRSSSPIGCVAVRISFVHGHCLSNGASASLFMAEASVPLHGGRIERTALCGPIRLKPLVNLTGQGVSLNLCSPLLMGHAHKVLWLELEGLFASDYNEISAAAAAAKQSTPTSSGPHPHRTACGLVRKGAIYRRQHLAGPAQATTPPEQATVSVSVYPASVAPNECDTDLVLRYYQSRHHLTRIVLAACNYSVEEEEFRGLSDEAKRALEHYHAGSVGAEREAEERSGGGEGQEQYDAFDVLCWMAAAESASASHLSW